MTSTVEPQESSSCSAGDRTSMASSSDVPSVLADFKGPHVKCRNCNYPRTDDGVTRTLVPDNIVSWSTEALGYVPVEYTDPKLLTASYADKLIGPDSTFLWNEIDGKTDRRSFTAKYSLDQEGRPLNPMGRTGVRGRGVLGKWGPNHAADPIATRWRRSEKTNEIEVDADTKKPILEFVAIERRDCGQWAIPGGMVDPGEQVTVTLKREFGEETLNSLEMGVEDKEALEKDIKVFFESGVKIYEGYVDDPRNTDNAWMETVAVNFHDENSDTIAKLPLKAGDDAVSVKWTPMNSDVELYASHKQFLEAVCILRNAHW